MLKLINNIHARIIIAVIFGFLLAAQTGIIGPCTGVPPSGENNAQCAEISKALEHPIDLIHNKQNSLTNFSETFAEASLISFVLFSAYSHFQTKKKNKD